jgi:hypothetical protein
MAQTLDPTLTLSSPSQDGYDKEPDEVQNQQNHSKYRSRIKEHDIEAILDVQGRGKYSKYLVKWKGLDDRYNSWEQLKDLHAYRGMIKEFMRVRNIEKARQYQKRIKENYDVNTKKEFVREPSNDSYDKGYLKNGAEESDEEYRPRPISSRLMAKSRIGDKDPRHSVMKSSKHANDFYVKQYDDGKMSHALLAESENYTYDEEPKPKVQQPTRDKYGKSQFKEDRGNNPNQQTDRTRHKNVIGYSSTHDKRAKPGFKSSSIVLVPEERHNSSFCEDSPKTDSKFSPSSSSQMHQNSRHVFPLKSLRMTVKTNEEDTEKPDEYWIAAADDVLGHVRLNKVMYLRLGWNMLTSTKKVDDRFFSIDEVHEHNPSLLAKYLRTFIHFKDSKE